MSWFGASAWVVGYPEKPKAPKPEPRRKQSEISTRTLQRRKRARELRRKGLTYQAIGAKLGVHSTTAYFLVHPERKRRYNDASEEYRRARPRNLHGHRTPKRRVLP